MRVTRFRQNGTIETPAALSPTVADGDGGAVWVDLDRDSPDDLAQLTEAFRFHSLAIEDARKTGQRPKIETYPDHLFITAHTCGGHAGGEIALEEVDIFFTKRAVVTVRSARAAPVDEARRRLERAGQHPRTADYVLYAVLDAIVDSYFPLLDRLDDEIETLEETLLRVPSRATLTSLFEARRVLNEARRHVVPLRDTLNVLMRRETTFVSEELIIYFRDVYDHILRITDQVDTHRDRVTGALEIYLSVTSNRLNEVVKVLTVITAAFAPLTVIGGIYGMNFERAYPAWTAPYGFIAIVAMMALITLGMLYLFRRRGWI